MLKPVLLISELFYYQTDDAGIYEQIIKKIVPMNFYTGVETAVIRSPAGRKCVRRLLSKYHLTLTQWLTKTMTDKGLSFCSMDARERGQAVRCAKECIDMAAECGAGNIALISGSAPSPQYYGEASKCLTDSLCSIALHCREYGVNLIVEPVDREQHKRQLLGPFDEAVELIASLRQVYPNCSLCWDTAHAALMGEDLEASILLTKNNVSQWHFSDAVLDANDAMYGDFHMMIGGKGFLTLERATDLLKYAYSHGAIEPGLTRIGMEVRSQKGEDPWANEERCRSFLAKALQNAG